MNERVQVIHGDSREVLKTLAENSVDSCVTDPPYALVSITKRFGADNAAPCKEGKSGVYKRASAGFMGQKWDTGETAFDPDFWREVLRVLKPGAHLLAFSGTRTYHRMTCAIEDAGFEIRDMVLWHYGSGFPKSHDVSKGIDRASGAVPISTGAFKRASIQRNGEGDAWVAGAFASHPEETKKVEITSPATDSAREWEGWGTALKPASEPIVLARKPLSEKTIAANVLRWGTGALNIDGCRIPVSGADARDIGREITRNVRQKDGWGMNSAEAETCVSVVKPEGRWPANLCTDGSEEVLAAFPTTGDSHPPCNEGSVRDNRVFGKDERPLEFHPGFEDSGSAARFFFSAKADSDDRMGSKHPTVKPVDLMRWLVRLVTPPNGLILDPFAGTGTTGIAAIAEQKRATLIEREPDYVEDIYRRLAHVAGDGPLSDAVKLRNKQKPGAGPLFGSIE